jgi:acetyl-CoA acetyltransferase family protein
MSAFEKVSIPYGAYWSTPFAKWQGSLANLHVFRFAAHVAKAELARRGIPASAFDHAILGTTGPQRHSFYGLPWLMSMIGNADVGGTVVAQACATSARVLATAAGDIEQGFGTTSLCITGDRTSNAPLVVYPEPTAQGGAPLTERWMLDNFSSDPLGGPAMVGTAENCARDWQISTEEQHEVVARRWQQYEMALADDHAFQKKYMTLPFEVPDPSFRKTVATLPGDEGIRASTSESLAKLKPVVEGGTVTFGGQTHPADGGAAMVLTTPERARALSADPDIEISMLSYGQARAKHGYMPAAPVPAARIALERAGLDIGKMDAVKTHNPFVVNDIVFARETGYDVNKMNNYGCSLIWGHPNGPTGMRLVIELIEELAGRGGGRGLFTGCAAGDSGMAVVVEVRDRRKH